MPRVVLELFEQQLQQFFGGRCQTVGVNSGTSALVAIMFSLDLKPGDEVITTPFTFTATSNAIVLAGGTPVFADINEDDYLINPGKVQELIGPKTRAILPVHLFGRVCNMEALCHLGKRHGLAVIEDACQAIGAEYEWSTGAREKAGVLADAAAFSFYKTKALSTFEGGAIIVPDRQRPRVDYDKIRSIARDGTAVDYDSGTGQETHVLKHIGFNFRMNELSALVGLERLKLHEPAILAELGRFGPQDGYYPFVIYDQPAYKDRGITGDCPVAEKIAQRVREGWYQ